MIISRRNLILGASSTIASPFILPSYAQAGALKVGLLLPYSGTFAALGEAITRAMELYVKQKGGSLGGRAIQFVKLDDESAPPKATELTNKLVFGEKVDVLCGTVHSGVAMAMAKIAKEAGLPTFVPNAGANDITRAACAPNIFRTSFGNSQVGYATGKAMIAAGIKEAATMTWRYGAGDESVAGFIEAFEAGGGKVLKQFAVPFPDVEFQSSLTEIASLKPQAVYSFFAGGGAAKFIKDYAAAGLNKSIPLWGAGFLTDGVEKAVGEAGNGVKTALHYIETLDNPENKALRAAFDAEYKVMPDVYAVQGYDTAQLLDIGLKAVAGDVSKKEAMFAAMSSASFASARGPFKLSAQRNPIQNFYLRELQNGANIYKGIAAEALNDSGKGCRA
jgi:branched-chain amino acid transport system substrate-binding protein